jgi:hypothetical protein
MATPSLIGRGRSVKSAGKPLEILIRRGFSEKIRAD